MVNMLQLSYLKLADCVGRLALGVILELKECNIKDNNKEHGPRKYVVACGYLNDTIVNHPPIHKVNNAEDRRSANTCVPRL